MPSNLQINSMIVKLCLSLLQSENKMEVGAFESLDEVQGVVNCQAIIPTYIIAMASATVLAHRLNVPQAGKILVMVNTRLIRVNLRKQRGQISSLGKAKKKHTKLVCTMGWIPTKTEPFVFPAASFFLDIYSLTE